MVSAIVERRLGRKWWLIVGGILCLNVMIFWLGYRKPAPRPVLEHEELLPYDTRLDIKASGLAPHLSPDWRLLLVTVVPEKSDAKLHYIDILQRKHRERGLNVVGLSGGTARQRNELREKYELSFPVVEATDENVRGLRIDTAHAHGGVVIIDSEQRVKFADFELPSEDELRMLVEKYLLGAIDYAYIKPEPNKFFQPGRKIVPLELEALWPRESLSLTGEQLAGKYIALFLADCASCEMEDYMRQLAEFEKSEATAGRAGVAVFAANFERAELNSAAMRHSVGTPLYILRNDAPELFSEYVTRYRSEKAGPLLVSFDQAGAVANVGPLFGEGK